MKFFFLILLLLVAQVSTYAQLITDSIKIEGRDRSFRFQPLAGTHKKLTVIFILHGSGGTGKDMMRPAAGLQKVAPAESLLLVYPDGYKHYWNECRKGAANEANLLDVNEQGFFYGMIQYLTARYNINSKSFFAIGLSGGGHMAYKLALTMPHQVKAISAVVANLPDTSNLDCADAKVPVAVMITNGTKDPLNHYEGGDIIINGNNWGTVRSSERTFAYWANLAGYIGKPAVTLLHDADTTNAETIARYSFSKKKKPEVTLLQVVGGVHAFPKDMDIFLESWKFFKREIRRAGKVN